MPGDKIPSQAINGIKREIDRKDQLGDLLLYAKKGDVAKITVQRNGETMLLEVPLTITVYMK